MYSQPLRGEPDPFFINTINRVCPTSFVMTGVGSSTMGSAIWTTANLALFFPFVLTGRHTYVRACVCNGTAVSGNFDIGVYSRTGTRLFSTGAQAQAGISQIQPITVSWTLDPGDYYMALVFNNIVATCSRTSPAAASLATTGCKQMATAYVLPTTATLVDTTTSYVPVFGISEKSWL